MKHTIALIYGGEGREREVSVSSAKNLFSAINKDEFDVLPVFIRNDGYWFIKDFNSKNDGTPTYPVRINSQSGFIKDGRIIEVSAAIIALHGDFGEDGRIQGALDTAHIEYVGCGVSASALCCDKIYTKILAEHLGIPTAKWIFADAGEEEQSVLKRAEDTLSYPMFVKPATLGSSIGISYAKDKNELLLAISRSTALSPHTLIEEAIDIDCEIECGFFQSKGVGRKISCRGMVSTNGEFYDYDTKYNSGTSAKISHGAIKDADTEAKLLSYSNALASLLCLDNISRIDFFLSRDGRIFFNEINTTPGMTETSLYPRLTEDMGLSKNEFINLLLREVIK